MKTLQFVHVILFGLMLSGCTLGQEPPAATPMAVNPATAVVAPTLAVHSATTATGTPSVPSTTTTPTITQTLPPTLTMAPTPTVKPTLTAQPTVTTPLASDAPQIVLERPVEGMFLQSPVEISGTVNMTQGQVRVTVQTPDGKPLGLPPVLLPTEPNGAGLNFRGTIPLGYAPTPRGAVMVVEYLDEQGNVAATAQQRTNVEGRFARIQYLVVEAPRPYASPAEPTILVYGAAAGPPTSVEVRLLDSAGGMLQSVRANLGWYQQGLPCDFSATLDTRPEGVSIEVVSLDPEGRTLEHVNVPLTGRQ